MKIKDWNIEALTGYKPITTYYRDFSIADSFGKEAILETYEKAVQYAKLNYKYLTELVMALNWKLWEHEKQPALCKLYCDLFYTLEAYAHNTLKGEELSYYLRTID